MPRSVRSLCAALLATLLTAACATQTRSLSITAPSLPERAELSTTPFFPQDRHQCGSAALATALAAAGFPAEPDRLDSEVYLPGREGSLQADMLAAARRHGALALPSPTTLSGLLTEVAAGRPVLILQNLGLGIAPRWHYAVVVGYDRTLGDIVLRSGTRQREVIAMRTFEHTWARSGFWGMMVLRSGALPLKVDPQVLEKALVQLEKYAAPAALLPWYRQAALRWPDSLVFMVGLGNAAYADGQLDRAEQAFRTASARHPQNAAVLNNLATVLQQRGQLDEALSVAERAVALGGEWQPAAQATRNAIRVAIGNPGAVRHAAPMTD